MRLNNLGRFFLISALSIASLSAPDIAHAAAGTVGTGTCASSVSDLSTVSDISTGGNCIFKFASGTTTITLPADVTSMNFLLVGGGGGGGGSSYPTRTSSSSPWRGFPGGGGGGGMVWTATIAVNSSQVETITVGAGGSAGAFASAGGTGGSTSLQTSTTYTATGGDAGGGPSAFGEFSSGGDGGSSASNTTGSLTARTEGNNCFDGAGGGAGAGEGSANNINNTATQCVAPLDPLEGDDLGSYGGIGGRGGGGITSSISGSSITYGGGGGGGSAGSSTTGKQVAGGVGGSGGGAGGGYPTITPVAGSENLGGGGGGGGNNAENGTNRSVGATGGSGVVVISFVAPISRTLSFANTSYSKTYGDASFSVTASPSVGSGTVTYSAGSSTACTVVSNTGVVTITLGTGTCAISASITSSGSYISTSTTVSATVTVSRASPTLGLSYPNSNGATYSLNATVDTLTSTNSGDGTLSFGTSSSASICTVNSTTGRITLTGAGSCIVSETSTVTSKYAQATTSATITIAAAISLAGTTQTLSATYGRAASDTVTATQGTGTKTFVLTGTSNAGITIDTATANQAVLNVSNTVAPSTYYETLTATDTLGANATYAITLTVSKADTLTITAGNPSTLTYTGSTAIFTPTYTTTGLSTVNTISGVTYTYSAPTVATCAQGGPCTVGDTGPAGGKVFYVSDTVIDVASGISTGGIYLEAAPAPVDKTEYNWCEGGSAPYTTEIFANGSEVGTGASNTLTIANNCTGGAGYEASHLTLGGYSDWFLPSSGEQIYMYYNMPTIGLVGNEANYLYAGSTETANWIASSLVPGAGIGNQNKGQATTYWPIRAFSVTVSSLPGYGPSATKPTNAGTYSITPSAVTFTGSGSTSNYQAVVYVAGSLTINKASQGALSVASLQAVFSANPTTITLYTTGGSDTGTVSFALDSGGSATSCTLSGTDNTTLSVASAGTCLVTATKAATTNYLVATASGTINFYTYLSYTTQSYGDAGSHTIVLTGGGTPWSVVAGSAPSISGISLASGPVGTVITISGTGFNGVNVVQLNRVDMASFTGLSPTSISATIPGGATSGPIYVENEFGGDFFFSGFTVTS